LILLLAFALTSTTIVVLAQDDAPTLVVVPGTIQSVLGCPSDWQPDCETTALIYDPDDDLWQATFELPAGSYDYKVALNGSWDVNYGLNAEQNGPNIPLVLEEPTEVKFVYDNRTHWIADSVNYIIANVPGNYQDEIGCPGEWQPDCLRSWLQDPDGDGIYVYSTNGLAAGLYEAKVALNESWTLNYGANGARDGANIQFSVTEDNELVEFRFNTSDNIMEIVVGGAAAPAVGNLFLAQAHWITGDTIAWNIPRVPGAIYQLHYSSTAELELTDEGVIGGDSITLAYERDGMTDDILAQFPHLERDFYALKIDEAELDKVSEILRSQIAVSARTQQGILLDATSVQIPGALDNLYAYDGALGVTIDGNTPTISVWAPTAQNVRFHLFADSDPSTTSEVVDMTFNPEGGVWSIEGESEWMNQFYLFEVTVYAPATRAVETNLVTDPYSFSLSMNSTRSQIIDLNDPSLIPEGWLETEKPDLDAPEDIVLYELHVRDFSIEDQTVSPENRGTFRAFTETGSNGMTHLQALADAGLTHVHILPAFDFATTNENPAEHTEPDPRILALFPPDSESQQGQVEQTRDTDGFNWGYDPLHYTVPEGSYSTNADGAERILEFREMVQALNQAGLRVVMDVVYNHTNASGQSERAVLDRIVPGYYHRLNATGQVESSTCCANTATEHYMMRKLMTDSVLTWATAYRVDGFRFDLMGHHLAADMVEVRSALNTLSVEENGVDGTSIYVYGEGWDFGEVAGNARGVNATQINLPNANVGIGTFNDRLRDSVRGGSPFGGWQEQGFVNGLYYDPNEVEIRSPDEQLDLLLLFSDRIRIGLAGNLRDYTFEGASGDMITGADVDYNGSPTGYTVDPQEHIVYVSAHDNETIFDVIQLKAPLTSTTAERVRMQNIALSIVTLSQGVPFFHAGDDILRSKSLDRNSYDSGDWFNSIDWTYQSNNWGIGLAPAWNNRDNWGIHQPLLANPNLAVSSADILNANAHFREMLSIRQSSPLFRLRTGDDVMARVRFSNTGPDQIPGVIVMDISDMVDGEDVDPLHEYIVVVFNATTETAVYTHEEVAGMALQLHQVQAGSNDPIVQESTFDSETGTFRVPARTTAVFVLPQTGG
jgi:pullulanase-type alpha-1,6-glucosidase